MRQLLCDQRKLFAEAEKYGRLHREIHGCSDRVHNRKGVSVRRYRGQCDAKYPPEACCKSSVPPDHR
jgi:hypothetical protein